MAFPHAVIFERSVGPNPCGSVISVKQTVRVILETPVCIPDSRTVGAMPLSFVTVDACAVRVFDCGTVNPATLAIFPPLTRVFVYPDSGSVWLRLRAPPTSSYKCSGDELPRGDVGSVLDLARCAMPAVKKSLHAACVYTYAVLSSPSKYAYDGFGSIGMGRPYIGLFIDMNGSVAIGGGPCGLPFPRT